MDGFKNTTKTSYDTASGRKFANGGMTVSRADMPGGEGPMSKPAMVAKYKCGGPVKKAMGGMATAAAPTTSGSKIITPEDKAKYAAEINTPYRETKPLGPRAQAQNARMGPVGRAKGGSVKKADQKIGRVMTEFTEGKLHSGSKEGPKVKSTKQAVAIALNEARAAGAKIPRVKKFAGGMMEEGGTYNERGKRATMAEIAAEGRRVDGRKPPVEGISTRPTDDSGRRMTDKELGMTPGGVERGASLTEGERRALARRMFGASATKAEMKALRDKTSKGMSDLDRARMMVRPLPRKEGGGVPAHSDRPMIRRAMGGLSSMPKGGKC